MNRLLIVLLLALVSSLSVSAQRTTRRPLKALTPVEAPTIGWTQLDTIAGDSAAAMAHITGYEKPLRAKRESFFVENQGSTQLVDGEFELTYSDLQGNMLHQRSVWITLDIPAGERRMVSIKSWDINTVFYYHLNVPQRSSAQATPYTVTIRPIQLSIDSAD